VTVSQLQLEPDLWLVEAQGRLDQMLTLQLEQTLNQLLADQLQNIIVDLSLATYINSGGLRCLLTGRRLARNQGGDLVICSLNTRLSEIFEMVGFDQILTIYDTRSEALKHFVA
jgi:anti-anti-sigma factor